MLCGHFTGRYGFCGALKPARDAFLTKQFVKDVGRVLIIMEALRPCICFVGLAIALVIELLSVRIVLSTCRLGGLRATLTSYSRLSTSA